MAEVDLAALLEREVRRPRRRPAAPGLGAPWRPAPARPALRHACRAAAALPVGVAATARGTVEAIIAEIDRQLAEQVNVILHHPEFQQIEASWRGLQFLVTSADTGDR